MAAPTNIDEFYAKMEVVRATVKTWNNNIPPDALDLSGVTKAQLMAWGLNDARATYEANRIAKMIAVKQALNDFNNASS